MKDVEEDEASRQEMETWMKTKQYDRVTERMKTVRCYDLNLVDRSDFIIAHLVPDVASWGSAEEIVTAVRMKKPIFVSMEGGKSKTPLWMLGMFPHKSIYNSLDEIVDIDNYDACYFIYIFIGAYAFRSSHVAHYCWGFRVLAFASQLE